MNPVEENKTYATEGSRWYRQDGQSVEDVIGKNGNPRKATLRDARKEGWVPSVTSILQIMAKPELERWKGEQIIRCCVQYPIGPFEEENEYVTSLSEKSKEQMSKARDTGSDVHGEIDRMLLDKKKLGHLPNGYALSEYAHAARNALFDLGVWTQRIAIETPFCSGGIAGKVDLKSVPDSLKDAWIVDWKTTSRTLEDGKCPDYDEYCAQLAAYSIGNFGELVPCYNVFLSTSKPGNYLIRKWEKEELDRGWHIYSACRTLWQLKNNYHFIK